MPALSDIASMVSSGAMLAPGWAESIGIPNPGAGVATATRTVPGDTWDRYMLARATFTSDATAGIRSPRFEVVDGAGNVMYAIPIGGGVGPSTAVTINLAANAADEVNVDGPVLTPTAAAPGAGADFSYTVPAGRRFQLESLDVSLTTSATVGNRTVSIVIDDGANIVWRWTSPVAQTASQTIEYVGGVGGTEYSAARNGVLAFALPALTVAGGYRIRSITTGIVAGDQWTGPHISQDLFSGGQGNQRIPDVVLQSGFAVRFIHDGVGAGDAWSGVRLYALRYPTNITRVPMGELG